MMKRRNSPGPGRVRRKHKKRCRVFSIPQHRSYNKRYAQVLTPICEKGLAKNKGIGYNEFVVQFNCCAEWAFTRTGPRGGSSAVRPAAFMFPYFYSNGFLSRLQEKFTKNHKISEICRKRENVRNIAACIDRQKRGGPVFRSPL